jgi:protein tyrosine phosphatase
MFVTDNYYRVCLKSTPSSDYINASFIDMRLHVATGYLMPSMSLKDLFNVGIQAEKSLHCHPGAA